MAPARIQVNRVSLPGSSRCDDTTRLFRLGKLNGGRLRPRFIYGACSIALIPSTFRSAEFFDPTGSSSFMARSKSTFSRDESTVACPDGEIEIPGTTCSSSSLFSDIYFVSDRGGVSIQFEYLGRVHCVKSTGACQ